MWITAAHNIYRSVWEMVTSRDFPGSSDGKAFACNEGTWVRSLAREDPLVKEMAIHSRTLAWKIPWMEEPGRLQSMGWQRVGHNWATSLTLMFSTQIFSVVQLLSHIRLFATSWSVACQAFLSFIISWSLLKLMSIESMVPSNHLILCHPLLLPSIFPNIKGVSSSHQATKVLGFQLQHQSFQWIFRTDFL